MDKNDNKIKKAVIFGVGRMGTSISCYMHKLGYHIVGVDRHRQIARPLIKLLGKENFTFYRTSSLGVLEDNDCTQILDFENPDVVISSLPYLAF